MTRAVIEDTLAWEGMLGAKIGIAYVNVDCTRRCFGLLLCVKLFKVQMQANLSVSVLFQGLLFN
jgi:hypothetical protein